MPASTSVAKLKALAERLEARRGEIEQTVLVRAQGVGDPGAIRDPAAYADGLRAAVAAALDYGFAGVTAGERSLPPVPVALETQARLAARNGVSLNTVLRRYFAGYSQLGFFLIEESSHNGLMSGDELQRLVASQATLFDRLLIVVGEEYARERGRYPGTVEERRVERIRGLLSGELLDASEIAYEFDGFHLGFIATGGNCEFLRSMATSLDYHLLIVRPDRRTVWAWLGSRRPLDSTDLARRLRPGPKATRASIGEPGVGLAGWRLTHRQAAAALAITEQGDERIVRYADVALLSSMIRDNLLVTSLRKLYIDPLERERDGGKTARETLRAYFAAERSVTSAAAKLGVKRHTVTRRLRLIEAAIGARIDDRGAELEAALRLEELV